MLLSVIIITQNKKELLLECIYALLNQSIEKSLYEIMVVDAGSKDNTEAELKKKGIINKVKYFYLDNTNTAKAKNFAILNSSSTYSIFIYDNIIPSGKFLETHLKMQKFNNNAVILGHTENEDLKNAPLYYKINHNSGLIDINDLPDDLTYNSFNSQNMSIKTSLLKEAGGFDENFKSSYIEDIDLGYRLKKMKNISFIYYKEIYAIRKIYDLSLKNIIRQEYTNGNAIKYLISKHTDEYFEVSNLVKKKSVFYSSLKLRKLFDKTILFILDNTIPVKKLMIHYYKSLALCARLEGFTDKKSNAKI